MIPAIPALLGVPLRGGRRLVADPAPPSVVTLTRAQAASRATALGADNATWSEFTADTPRLHAAARRLLVEGQRTNLLAYARTPGSTGWTISGATLAGAVAGPDGNPASANRIQEDTTAAAHRTITENIAATSGTSYVHSAMIRAGSCAFAQLALGLTNFGANAFANFDLAGGTVGTVGSAVTRAAIRGPYNGYWWCEVAAPATATGSAANSQICLVQNASSARAPSFAGTSRFLDVGWNWIEQGGFASTPVLPPEGSPAASTRGADLLGTTLAAIGVGANGACTVLVWALLPQAAPGGVDQMLVSIDDGTNNNRYRMFNLAGGSAIQVGRSIGGAGLTGTAGTMTPGTAFKVGMSVDGGGRVAGSFNGGAVIAQPGGPTSGLTTLRIGNNAGNTGPAFGQFAECQVLPYAVPDAVLPGLVAALPG